MSYTITQGVGSKARIYEGLTAEEAVTKAERMLADGRKDVAISGPHGPINLATLKRILATGGSGGGKR
jgi:hypothetical protein